MTNRQRLQQAGIVDEATIMCMFDEDFGYALCDICNERVEKNLGPSNPCCEGRWCGEALAIWLDEEETCTSTR